MLPSIVDGLFPFAQAWPQKVNFQPLMFPWVTIASTVDGNS
ncbi:MULTISPECIES: hypothetical protein [unclassified Synechocystis]|nr:MULTISPECIES: hypothetical protein [unclassified Synechocystis]